MVKKSKDPVLRAKRYARELEALCEDEGSEGSGTGNQADISRLLTLCSLMHGTDAFREYVRDLLMDGILTGFPKLLLVHVKKGEFGIFDLPVAMEFERMQILFGQPRAISIALAAGEKKRARKLYRRLVRWRVQFEKLYGECAEKGVGREARKKELERRRESYRDGK
ncbi:MAG: hypothetical protein G01um101429_1131 [Parcubacteria group bacterium Gr01-1014_29]|nr:MAG: hypothetical protein G01um101429_1131 [Parcubacteria group bacterium Gr01-1014_29]